MYNGIEIIFGLFVAQTTFSAKIVGMPETFLIKVDIKTPGNNFIFVFDIKLYIKICIFFLSTYVEYFVPIRRKSCLLCKKAKQLALGSFFAIIGIEEFDIKSSKITYKIFVLFAYIFYVFHFVKFPKK